MTPLVLPIIRQGLRAYKNVGHVGPEIEWPRGLREQAVLRTHDGNRIGEQGAGRNPGKDEASQRDT